MSELIERIAELKNKAKTFCIITVANANGAKPRKAGARDIVFSDGCNEGTVGGGCIEVKEFKQSLQVINTGKPLLKKY